MPHRRRNKSKEDGTNGATVGPDKKLSTPSSGTPGNAKNVSNLSQPRKNGGKKTTPENVFGIDEKIERLDAEETTRQNEALTAEETRLKQRPSSLSDSTVVEACVDDEARLRKRLTALSTSSPTDFDAKAEDDLDNLGATGEGQKD